MNELSKIYQKIKISNPNIEDGKARQQAWIMRDQLLFERSAAAGAAGAGAGGAGGGRAFARRGQTEENQYVVTGYIEAGYFV